MLALRPRSAAAVAGQPLQWRLSWTVDSFTTADDPDADLDLAVDWLLLTVTGFVSAKPPLASARAREAAAQAAQAAASGAWAAVDAHVAETGEAPPDCGAALTAKYRERGAVPCFEAQPALALRGRSLMRGAALELQCSCALPEGLLPSFRGKSLRVLYVLSAALKVAGEAAPRVAHAPFRVLSPSSPASGPLLDLGAVLRGEGTGFARPAVEVGSPGALPGGAAGAPGDALRVLAPPELGAAAAATFAIRAVVGGEEGSMEHVANVVLPRQRFEPGATVGVGVEFARAGSCVQLLATLVRAEQLSAAGAEPDVTVLDSAHVVSAGMLGTSLELQLPPDAATEFRSSLVSLEYALCIDFAVPAGLGDLGGGGGGVELPLRDADVQRLAWSVPVHVVPPT